MRSHCRILCAMRPNSSSDWAVTVDGYSAPSLPAVLRSQQQSTGEIIASFKKWERIDTSGNQAWFGLFWNISTIMPPACKSMYAPCWPPGM
jgi:hypothetical protein